MGYYMRAFCRTDKVPTIKEIFEWALSQGIKLDISEDFKKIDLESNEWHQICISYKKGKIPILSEINRDDATDDCLFKDEIDEFKDDISELPILYILGKRKIENHLKKTKFIVANKLPSSDIDDDGYNANWIFLKYFELNCGGIIQADGEGFYVGDKLILRLD